jgi:hypothetical protein
MLAGLGLAIVTAGLVLLGLDWAARQPPDFYRQSLARAHAVPAEEGERLQQQALALHNQLHHEGRFEVRFTQDEINGWLASDLPEKFPRLLPQAFSDPRVAIDEEAVRLAIRYRRGNVDTVFSLAGEAYLTEEPNELAIRIRQVRAGLIPVPLGNLLDEIQQRAVRAGIALRWTEEDGDPVGLVRIPSEIEPSEGDDEPQRFLLEGLRFEPGAFVVIGRTENGEREKTADQIPASTADHPLEIETHQR